MNIKNTIWLNNCSKKMKLLGLNLTQNIQDFYAKSAKTLKLDGDENKWKYTIFMDWKIQQGKDVNSLQTDLFVYSNYYHNLRKIMFLNIGKIILTFTFHWYSSYRTFPSLQASIMFFYRQNPSTSIPSLSLAIKICSPFL